MLEPNVQIAILLSSPQPDLKTGISELCPHSTPNVVRPEVKGGEASPAAEAPPFPRALLGASGAL